MVGVFLYPSVRQEACGARIANMGVYLCIVLLALFPFSFLSPTFCCLGKYGI